MDEETTATSGGGTSMMTMSDLLGTPAESEGAEGLAWGLSSIFCDALDRPTGIVVPKLFEAVLALATDEILDHPFISEALVYFSEHYKKSSNLLALSNQGQRDLRHDELACHAASLSLGRKIVRDPMTTVVSLLDALHSNDDLLRAVVGVHRGCHIVRVAMLHPDERQRLSI
jgi:hypothetical protein